MAYRKREEYRKGLKTEAMAKLRPKIPTSSEFHGDSLEAGEL